MGLRINTNLPSLAAQRQIGLSQRQNEGAMKALASGNRFDDNNESSADHSIAEQIKSQLAGTKAGLKNAENSQSFIQVAEGGLNEQNNIVIRLRELAVQAASDTLSDDERKFVNTEFQQLSAEVDRIAQSTKFGSQKLLAGQGKEYDFQVGAYRGAENVIKYSGTTDTRASELGVDSMNVESKDDALEALEGLDTSLMKIAEARSNFGAAQSRLDSALNHSGMMVENLSAAHSRIADTNIAEAASKMYRQQALQQYQISILDQANRFPGSVIRLVG